jgi:lipopolysaccharide export system permease protein
MRLLDRYLLRELMVPLPYCLAGFLIFWISSDAITELEDFREQRMGLADVLEYYVTRLPEYLVLLLPLVLLLSLLYAMTTHARHQEFTAMRAAGISLWRFCLPYFMVGFLLSVLVFGLNEGVVPWTKEHAERVRSRGLMMEEPGDARWRRDLRCHNEREGRLWQIGAFNLDTGEMRGLLVEWERADGTPALLRAEHGEYVDGAWEFRNGQLWHSDPESAVPIEAFSELRVEELRDPPNVLRSEHRVSQMSSIRRARKVTLTVAEIRDYRYLHPVLSEREGALLDTQLHARLAQPWTCLVVVFISVPFGVVSARRNAFVGVASSIFICVAFFILQQLALGLGTGQHLPPLVAAWFPNGLFGLAGLLLSARMR